MSRPVYVVAGSFVLAIIVGLAWGAKNFVTGENLKWIAVEAAKAAFDIFVPAIVKAFKPKDLTKEQLQKHRQGEDYNSKRPPGAGHS